MSAAIHVCILDTVPEDATDDWGSPIPSPPRPPGGWLSPGESIDGADIDDVVTQSLHYRCPMSLFVWAFSHLAKNPIVKTSSPAVDEMGSEAGPSWATWMGEREGAIWVAGLSPGELLTDTENELRLGDMAGERKQERENKEKQGTAKVAVEAWTEDLAAFR